MSKKKDPFKIKRKAPIRIPTRKKSEVYKKVSPKQIGRLVKRAYAISTQIDEVLPLYKELDEITYALLNMATLKKEGALDKYGVAIIDKFADRNTAFRTVAIKRFELKWLRRL